jgi:hypothetical protein
MLRHFYQLVVVVVTILLLAACSDDDDPTTAQQPLLSVTPIDIAYDPADSSYGDIMFVFPVFTPFGASLGNDRFSFAMEYFTVLDAPVRAVTEGIVDTIIVYPDEGYYEVHVTSIPGSDYTVIYDYVYDLSILDASPVTPGSIIGKSAPLNDSTGLTQLKISVGEGSNLRYYCPIRFGEASFVALHLALLQEYNRRGFEPHYDSLCLKNVLYP